MGVHYIHAKKGYVFQLTDEGRKIRSVAVKYQDSVMSYRQYQRCIPQSWLTNGYVEEVPADEKALVH